MIHTEKWYKEADAVSYPQEMLEQNPILRAELIGIHKDDFEYYLSDILKMVQVIERAFPEERKDARDFYKEVREIWFAWASLLDEFEMTGRGQGAIHNSERELWGRRKSIHKLYLQAMDELQELQ